MHAPYHPSAQACMQLLLTNTRGLEQRLQTKCKTTGVFTGWHDVDTLATVVSADHAH